MPTVPKTIRLTPEELAAAQRAADGAGLNFSDYVRRELGLRGGPIDIDGLASAIEAIDRRLSRLEELAGL